MSRIGKLPIAVPSSVKVELQGQKISVKGSKGELQNILHSDVEVTFTDGKIWVKPANDTAQARSMWGMTRSVVRNMVTGVSEGFTVKLEINGVGYRAAVDKGYLTLFLGFSHEIKYSVPAGVTIVAEKPTLIAISGYDRQKVGQVAAEIRALRKPEPYKGKGVKYENEKIRLKEGKKK